MGEGELVAPSIVEVKRLEHMGSEGSSANEAGVAGGGNSTGGVDAVEVRGNAVPVPTHENRSAVSRKVRGEDILEEIRAICRLCRCIDADQTDRMGEDGEVKAEDTPFTAVVAHVPGVVGEVAGRAEDDGDAFGSAGARGGEEADAGPEGSRPRETTEQAEWIHSLLRFRDDSAQVLVLFHPRDQFRQLA